MAIILPATTGYHVRQAQDVSAGAPSYAEHWRDAIENQHWLLAHTARTAHWSDTREIPISNAKYGAGWNEVFRYAFKTGIGKAATIRPNYQLCATANVAAGCNFRIALYSAAGAALGAVDTALAIAAAQWYGPSDWSDTHGALEPETVYEARIYLSAGAGGTTTLHSHHLWEEIIAASSDLA